MMYFLTLIGFPSEWIDGKKENLKVIRKFHSFFFSKTISILFLYSSGGKMKRHGLHIRSDFFFRFVYCQQLIQYFSFTSFYVSIRFRN